MPPRLMLTTYQTQNHRGKRQNDHTCHTSEF